REAHYDPAAHFETGDDVTLFVQDGKPRDDWLVLNVSALASPDQRAAATATSAPSVTSQNPLPASAGAEKPSTSVPPSIEERLRRLKHLREQDLITEEEYNRKRSEILDQL
ncbi:MAG TPA: SHOCT domain-containing protein, partial [Steroidobacteraceae bacterium]|nr:SHOCT domain-containing protein [Steroidobacteraceae bacterium]